MINESLDIKYTQVNEWTGGFEGSDSGFQGSFDITNNGETSVEVESFDFDLPRDIENIWGAQIVTNIGGDYTVETFDWNTTINPGQTINIGFIGDGSAVTPENFDLETEGEEMPTGGEGEMPTEGEGEMPTEGEGEMPTGGEGEMPTEGEGEMPTGGEGEMPTEGEGEMPTEGEGEMPTEGEGEMPTEGEGEMPTEGEGEMPTEGEGEMPTEGEGEMPTEGEGEMPTEGEGEMPTEGEGEMPTEGGGEMPTEGEGEMPTGGETPTGGDNPFVQSTSTLSLGEVNQGRGTFTNTDGVFGNSGYDPLTGSAAIGIAAINTPQWNGSEASGAFLQVSGPEQRAGSDPIVVQVYDQLPDRGDGLDLSPQAFAQVADPIDGIVDIEYELIGPSDDFRTPYGFTIGQGLVAEGLEGTNPFFVGVRFNNHRYPIESVEIIEEDGDLIDLPRGSDNRFSLDNSVAINGVQDLEVTDIFGQTVILDDINITGGADTSQITGEQFELI